MPKRQMNSVYAHEGFLLRFEKRNKDGIELLYCSERKTIVGCRSYAHRDPTTGTITLLREHERHESNDDRANAGLVKKMIIDRAETSNDAPRDIIHLARQNYGSNAVALAGSVETLSHRIHRARSQDDIAISMANSPNPVFVGPMKTASDGSQFLIFDLICQRSGGRIVCFATGTMIQTLEKSEIVLVDGTFDVAPEPFTQLWIVHGKVADDTTLPIVYVLMERKTTDDYATVLSEIKLRPELQKWDPKHLIADLETAEQKAFLDAFPSITEHFCLFHVLQSWRRKIQNLGLSKAIVFGKELFEFWSLLRCLPFGDPQNIDADFDLMVTTVPAPHSQATQKLINYLKRYYIGNGGNAKFPVSQWNVQLSTLSSMPRTSNCVESSHRNLASCIKMCAGRRRIRISDLISKLKLEAEKLQFDIETLASDPTYKILHSRKIKDILKDKKLIKVVENAPNAPNQPLFGLDYYRAVKAAWKY